MHSGTPGQTLRTGVRAEAYPYLPGVAGPEVAYVWDPPPTSQQMRKFAPGAKPLSFPAGFAVRGAVRSPARPASHRCLSVGGKEGGGSAEYPTRAIDRPGGFVVQPVLQDEPRHSRGFLGPSFAEHRCVRPNYSGPDTEATPPSHFSLRARHCIHAPTHTGASNRLCHEGYATKARVSEVVMCRHGHVPLWDRPQSASNLRFEVGLKLFEAI